MPNIKLIKIGEIEEVTSEYKNWPHPDRPPMFRKRTVGVYTHHDFGKRYNHRITRDRRASA